MRIESTLLLATAAATFAWAAPVPPTTAQMQPARFFLPEEPHNQHTLLLETLETLGIERFVPPNSHDPSEAAQNPLYLWSFLPNASTQVALVWSVAASPPYSEVRFPKQFRPILNHLPGADKLTTGDGLAKHIERCKEKHGDYYFNFVPNHFELPRDDALMAHAFPTILKQVEFEMKRERDWYIYQRFLVREKRASGDERADTPAQLIISAEQLAAARAGDFAGKDVEVSAYVEPLLLDGHKFRVGFYVAVTSLDPLRIYVFSHARVQIAKVLYPTNDIVGVQTDRGAYTFDAFDAPWDVAELQPLFREFPSATREGSNAWTIVKRFLQTQGLDTTRLQRAIHDAIVRVIASNRGHFQSVIAQLQRAQATDNDSSKPTDDLTDKFFDLWKFDFEVDDTGKPWLVTVDANPSLVPEPSVFGTDEAIKKRLVFDLVNMVGVHPQAKQPFEQFYRPPKADATTFCTHKCADTTRAWDTTCWSCPGWFAPSVAQRLFVATREHARRGRFDLVFPDLTKDHSRFLDTPLTDHDVAFDRYLKSVSNAFAEKPEAALALDRNVVCVYREHCSDHGDCVNGACKCDRAYEGTTCYIPKDMDRETAQDNAATQGAAGAQAHESWKDKVGHLWHRSTAPAVRTGALSGDQDAAADARAPSSDQDAVSPAKLGLVLLLVAALMLAAYRVCSAYAPRSHDRKSN